MNDDGRVVLVSSTAGQRGEAFHSDYAATKGAIISLVKGLCVEVGRRGITVNAVAPGWIDTEMSASALRGPGKGGDRRRDSNPQGGHGRGRGRADRDALLATGPPHHR